MPLLHFLVSTALVLNSFLTLHQGSQVEAWKQKTGLDKRLIGSAPGVSLAWGLAVQVSFLPLRPSILKPLHWFETKTAH